MSNYQYDPSRPHPSTELEMYTSICAEANACARVANMHRASNSAFYPVWQEVASDWAMLAESMRPTKDEVPNN